MDLESISNRLNTIIISNISEKVLEKWYKDWNIIRLKLLLLNLYNNYKLRKAKNKIYNWMFEQYMKPTGLYVKKKIKEFNQHSNIYTNQNL